MLEATSSLGISVETQAARRITGNEQAMINAVIPWHPRIFKQYTAIMMIGISNNAHAIFLINQHQGPEIIATATAMTFLRCSEWDLIRGTMKGANNINNTVY